MEYAEAEALGRVCTAWIDIGFGRHMILAVVYGAVDGSRNADARMTTDSILDATIREME